MKSKIKCKTLSRYISGNKSDKSFYFSLKQVILSPLAMREYPNERSIQLSSWVKVQNFQNPDLLNFKF